MRAIEFQGKLTGQESISIPDKIACALPSDGSVRVILLWENDEQAEWKALSAERFANAYSDDDDVYESLVNAPGAR
jgi:hypothetical protein